jgi:DNA-binding transcriptional MerR regulator
LPGGAGWKSMAIDTLKLARRLRDAGFNEAQAEAVADGVREGTESANLVTRGDLALTTAELRSEIAELRAEIAALRSDLKAEISALKSELLGRMFQMILGAVLVNAIAMAGLMFAFAKLLGH